MGRVVVPIVVENSADIDLGKIVRKIETIALVDTGAAKLCICKEFIDQLGLAFVEESKVDTADGIRSVKRYRNAWITIMGRSCQTEVLEINSKTKALVGYLVLQSLDLTIDPKHEQVIPNPEHGEEMILDLL